MSRPLRVRRSRKILFSMVLAVMLSLILEGLLGLTGLVSVFEPIQCDPDDGLCRYTLNDRLAPLPRVKPPGTTRIVVIGESAVKGYPFDGAGFPQMMQVMLDRGAPAGTRWEVINLGVNGVNTGMLREILRDALPRLRPDLVVVYAGNNELLGKDRFDDLRYPRFDRLHWWMIRRCRLWNLPRAAAKIYYSQGAAISLLSGITHQEKSHPGWLNPPAERERIRGLFIHHLNQIIELAHRQRTSLVLCTVGSNLGGWVPMKSVHDPSLDPRHREELDRDLDTARSLLREGSAGAALPLTAEVAAGDPQYAKGRFFNGRALLLTGDHDRAVAELEAAVEQADFFHQTPPSFNREIRRLARNTQTPLIDVDQALRDHAPDGIPGFDSFFDGCHPTLKGNHLIAGTILEGLARRRLIPGLERIEPLAGVLAGLPARRPALGLAMFNQALVLTFLYPPPEYQPVAVSIIERSLDFDMSPVVASTYLGYLEVMRGRPREAAVRWTQARNEDYAAFGALIRDRLFPVVKIDDPWLFARPVKPQDETSLYPGANPPDLPPLAPRDQDLRFRWDGRAYTPVSP